LFNGLTPFINDDGNWQIGDIITDTKAQGPIGPEGPTGPAGADGSDANVTKENITAALNYEPVNPKDVYRKDEVYNKEEVAQLIGSGGGTGGGSLLQIQTDYE
jgi:hypothetical protein